MAPVFTPDDGQDITDLFGGVKYWWTHTSQEPSDSEQAEEAYYPVPVRSRTRADKKRNAGSAAFFQLKVAQKDLDYSLIRSYLQHITAESNDITRRNSELKVGKRMHRKCCATLHAAKCSAALQGCQLCYLGPDNCVPTSALQQ